MYSQLKITVLKEVIVHSLCQYIDKSHNICSLKNTDDGKTTTTNSLTETAQLVAIGLIMISLINSNSIAEYIMMFESPLNMQHTALNT